MFKGEGSDELNRIYNTVVSVRRNLINSNPVPGYDPKLVIYVGYKQMYVLHSIDHSDPHSVKNGKFEHCYLVRVTEEDYLHVVEKK